MVVVVVAYTLQADVVVVVVVVNGLPHRGRRVYADGERQRHHCTNLRCVHSDRRAGFPRKSFA